MIIGYMRLTASQAASRPASRAVYRQAKMLHSLLSLRLLLCIIWTMDGPSVCALSYIIVWSLRRAAYFISNTKIGETQAKNSPDDLDSNVSK